MHRSPLMSRLPWFLGSGLLAVVLPAFVCAGTICGTVRDAATHAAIDRAGVFLRYPDGDYTGLHAATDAAGAYCVPGVPAGTYDLEVRRDGYRVGYRRNVTVNDGASGVDLEVDGPTGLRVPFPNPVAAEVTLSFRLAEAGRARLSVYDLRGRLVQGWESAALPAGEHAYRWSMFDRDGRRLAPGLYIVRLAAGPVTQLRTFVYLPQ